MGGGQLFNVNSICGIKNLLFVFGLNCWIPTKHYYWWNAWWAVATINSFLFCYFITPFVKKMESFIKFGICVLIYGIFIVCTKDNFIYFLSYHNLTDAPYEFTKTFPVYMLIYFMFGMLLYFAIQDRKEVFYVFAIILLGIIGRNQELRWTCVYTVILALAVKSSAWIKRDLLCEVVKYISEISYALFLIHPVILYFVNVFCNKLEINNMLKFGAMFVCSITAATIIHFKYEIKVVAKIKRIIDK